MEDFMRPQYDFKSMCKFELMLSRSNLLPDAMHPRLLTLTVCQAKWERHDAPRTMACTFVEDFIPGQPLVRGVRHVHHFGILNIVNASRTR